VDIIFGTERQVVINDARKLDNIQSARSDIGGDQNFDLPLLEVIQRSERAA